MKPTIYKDITKMHLEQLKKWYNSFHYDDPDEVLVALVESVIYLLEKVGVE